MEEGGLMKEDLELFDKNYVAWLEQLTILKSKVIVSLVCNDEAHKLLQAELDKYTEASDAITMEYDKVREDKILEVIKKDKMGVSFSEIHKATKMHKELIYLMLGNLLEKGIIEERKLSPKVKLFRAV
jgi:hypothetical protein